MAPFASVGATEAGRLLVEDTRRQILWRKRGGCAVTLALGGAIAIAFMAPLLQREGAGGVTLIVVVLPFSLFLAGIATLPLYALWGVVNRVTFEARAARLGLPARELREAVVQTPPGLVADALYAFVDAQISRKSP